MERGVELVERIFPARACGAVDREAGTGVRSRRRVLMIEVWGWETYLRVIQSSILMNVRGSR